MSVGLSVAGGIGRGGPNAAGRRCGNGLMVIWPCRSISISTYLLVHLLGTSTELLDGWQRLSGLRWVGARGRHGSSGRAGGCRLDGGGGAGVANQGLDAGREAEAVEAECGGHGRGWLLAGCAVQCSAVQSVVLKTMMMTTRRIAAAQSRSVAKRRKECVRPEPTGNYVRRSLVASFSGGRVG